MIPHFGPIFQKGVSQKSNSLYKTKFTTASQLLNGSHCEVRAPIQRNFLTFLNVDFPVEDISAVVDKNKNRYCDVNCISIMVITLTFCKQQRAVSTYELRVFKNPSCNYKVS